MVPPALLCSGLVCRTGFLSCLVLACAAASAVAQTPVTSGYEDESPLRFRTADVVPAEVLKGPNYALEPEAALVDGHFVFRIQTQWGILIAHGKPMLSLRLQEMYAIERAQQMNREPQLIGGFLSTLDDSRRGAELLLADPVGSVLRVPAGIEKGLNGLLSPTNRRSGGETRRRIAAELDCDPETSNPVLAPLLDWIAVRQGVGGLAGKVGLNLVLPGLALIPATAQFKDMLASKSPEEINAYIERELVALGFDRGLSQALVRSSGLTTLQRLMVLEQLRPLAGVTGHNSLLQRAVSVRTTDEAMNVVYELVQLNQLHTTRPIAAVNPLKYPLVTFGDGGQMVVCTSGYLVFNESLQQFATECRSVMKQPAVEMSGTFGLSGNAEQLLQASGIQRASAVRAE